MIPGHCGNGPQTSVFRISKGMIVMAERALVSRELASLFSLLGHPDRVRIIEELRQKEQNVTQLQDILGISHSRVSQHIAKLKAHRLLKERRQGRSHYFSLVKPDIADWILAGLHYLESNMPSHDDLHDAIPLVQEAWRNHDNRNGRS